MEYYSAAAPLRRYAIMQLNLVSAPVDDLNTDRDHPVGPGNQSFLDRMTSALGNL